MFGRFLDRFPPEHAEGCSGEELPALIDPLPGGFADLMTRYAGASFGDGLYRLFTPEEVVKWTALAGGCFRGAADTVACFGMDWTGRQFALDVRRVERGEPLTSMLDVGAGEIVEIPASFAELHDEALLGFPDVLLYEGLYAEWRAHGGLAPVHGKCVGWRLPLFLGGEEEASNLVMHDAESYWRELGDRLAGSERSVEGSAAAG